MDFQARSGSELAFDANSSSRTSPRYVSMTFISAAQTGTGCPRLSSTRGARVPFGEAFGAGAVVAMPRANRRCSTDGGPRQLGGWVPVAQTASVEPPPQAARAAHRGNW